MLRMKARRTQSCCTRCVTGRMTDLGTIIGKGRLPDRHIFQTHAVGLGVVDAIHL